jgi:hypothetical protein
MFIIEYELLLQFIFIFFRLLYISSLITVFDISIYMQNGR